MVGVQARASANSEQAGLEGGKEQPMTPAERPVLARHPLLCAGKVGVCVSNTGYVTTVLRGACLLCLFLT